MTGSTWAWRSRVFRVRTKWRLPDLQGDIESSAANYKSAEDHEGTLFDKLTLMVEAHRVFAVKIVDGDEEAGKARQARQDLAINASLDSWFFHPSFHRPENL